MNLPNKKNYAVYIGRFQPFHQGHLACVGEGLAMADTLIILIGSVDQPRSQKNPWSYKERRQMIRASLTQEQNSRVKIAALRDYHDDRQWVKAVQKRVKNMAQGRGSIVLIGHARDGSSYYLSRFPDWELKELPEYKKINATQIRRDLIRHGEIQNVSQPVAEKIRHFLKGKTFRALVSNTATGNTCSDVLDRNINKIADAI